MKSKLWINIASEFSMLVANSNVAQELDKYMYLNRRKPKQIFLASENNESKTTSLYIEHANKLAG